VKRHHPRRAPLHHVLLALFLTLTGCADCGKNIGEGVAKQLTGSVDNFVNQMPGMLGQIDHLLENNIGAISDGLAKQIQEINRLLRQNIDGINATLNGTIDNVDAMLAARMDQLFKFTRNFLADLDKVVTHQVTQLTYNLESLIKTLEVSGTELLETAGFQVVRTLREGNRTVAVVIGGVVETIVLVISGSIMALVVIFAGVFFIRYRKSMREGAGRLPAWQLGVGSGFFAMTFAVAALMVFLPGVRASVASTRVPLSDEQSCTEALPLGGEFVGRNRGLALAPAQREEVVKLMGALYQCEVNGVSSAQRAKARGLAADLERMLGAAVRCLRAEDCDAARRERCEVTVGICTTRCELNQHCAAGEVCHGADSIGVCGPPCGPGAECQLAGTTCKNGTCELPPPPEPGPAGTPGGGGKRWPRDKFFVAGGHFRDVILKICPGPGCPLPCTGGRCVVDPRTDRGGRPVEVRPDELRRPVLERDLRRILEPRFTLPSAARGIEASPR
jgi:hypothetical protein